jgi:hypothetical protein
MPANETLGILAQIFVCFYRSQQDLACDVLGHVPGPRFGGIEGDDPDGIAVLTSSSSLKSSLRMRKPRR